MHLCRAVSAASCGCALGEADEEEEDEDEEEEDEDEEEEDESSGGIDSAARRRWSFSCGGPSRPSAIRKDRIAATAALAARRAELAERAAARAAQAEADDQRAVRDRDEGVAAAIAAADIIETTARDGSSVSLRTVGVQSSEAATACYTPAPPDGDAGGPPPPGPGTLAREFASGTAVRADVWLAPGRLVRVCIMGDGSVSVGVVSDVPLADGATYTFETVCKAAESEPVRLHAAFIVAHHGTSAAIIRNRSAADVRLIVLGAAGNGAVAVSVGDI